MEEVQGREEVYFIQTGGWVGVREEFLEEVTSRLRLDKCVNVSMKGKIAGGAGLLGTVMNFVLNKMSSRSY